MKYLHKFTIDRAKWATGHDEDPDGNCLLGPTGMKCCLGFYAESLGAKPEHLKGCGDLESLRDNGGPDLPLIPHECDFISRNDSDNGTRLHREQRLITMFRERGIKVAFKGKYPAKEAE